MPFIKTLTKILAVGAVSAAMAAPAYADTLKVGAIYPSPVGDVGWAKQLDNGLNAISDRLGDQVETFYVENIPEGPDAARIMNQMVAQQGADMIILGSFGYMNDGLKLAARHPDVTFLHASGFKLSENFSNFQTRNYESAYLAGMAAGYVTESDTLGVVAAYAIPEVIGIINAYTMGAQETNPDISVKVVWLNSWFNPTKAQEAARSLIAQDSDVLFSLYQDTPSVVTVAEEEGVYVVNTSSDMAKYAPTKLLTSLTISWADYFVAKAEQTIEGTFEGDAFWGGIADNAVNIASLSEDLSVEQIDAVLAKKEAIASGSFLPFTGPITNQDGDVAVAAGTSMADGDIKGISWLVQGVETKLPN